MRTIKELLELMLKNRTNRLRFGLCVVASDLYKMMVITKEEYLRLQKYIDENQPRNLYNWFGLRYTQFYWKPGDRKPRIKWLKKHIGLNS
jgi:hypothetical protein